MTRRGLMTGGGAGRGRHRHGGVRAARRWASRSARCSRTACPTRWQDVGPEADFNDETYVPRVINIVADDRRGRQDHRLRAQVQPRARQESDEGQDSQPFVAISTRCAHLGCPVRYIQASQRSSAPATAASTTSRARSRAARRCARSTASTRASQAGRVEIGDRFSLNSELERFAPRDPSNHLDGLWQYLYPSRPTT